MSQKNVRARNLIITALLYVEERELIMKNPEVWMAVVSIIGALAGIYFTIVVDPENNYYYFMGLFAMIGIIIGNLVLLAVNEIIREAS